jgi:transcriptional regulator with XRE-family HTH domain
MTMGERITALRKGRGMTQEQLAERISVTRQSVSKWELDQATPEIGCAVAICDVFGVSLDYLVRGEDRVSSPTEIGRTGEHLQNELTSALPPLEPATDQTKIKPLTPKGYFLLVGGALLIALELCLHILPLGQILDYPIIAFLCLFLYAVVIPLPALYLVIKRWIYPSSRAALKHLWKVTVAVMIPSHLLLTGGLEVYFTFFLDRDKYASLFWQTNWETMWYKFLVGEALILAVLLPLLVCFHRKKWFCILAYFLSWGAFPYVSEIADMLPDIVIAGRHWVLIKIALRLALILLVIASQVILYIGFMKEDGKGAPPVPPTRFSVASVITLCTLGIPTVVGGVYYGLGLAGLPTVYLPAILFPLPVLLVVLFHGRGMDSSRVAWRMAGITAGIFLPLMMLAHGGTTYFTQYILYSLVSATPQWDSYLLVSLAAALVGGNLSIPAMVALRKRPWLCLVGYIAAMIGTIVAIVLLPDMLF